MPGPKRDFFREWWSSCNLPRQTAYDWWRQFCRATDRGGLTPSEAEDKDWSDFWQWLTTHLHAPSGPHVRIPLNASVEAVAEALARWAWHEAGRMQALDHNPFTVRAKSGKIMSVPERTADAQLSATAKQKLDAAIAAHKRRLDREFEGRVRAESMKWINEVRIPSYEKKIGDLIRMLSSPRNAVMTSAEYKKVVMCLHPDGLSSRTEEQLAEALRIFIHYKPKMVADEEEKRRALSNLPRTVEELLARKKPRT
jgi:hypothetical protein